MHSDGGIRFVRTVEKEERVKRLLRESCHNENSAGLRFCWHAIKLLLTFTQQNSILGYTVQSMRNGQLSITFFIEINLSIYFQLRISTFHDSKNKCECLPLMTGDDFLYLRVIIIIQVLVLTTINSPFTIPLYPHHQTFSLLITLYCSSYKIMENLGRKVRKEKMTVSKHNFKV